jgi:hypothetical protein
MRRTVWGGLMLPLLRRNSQLRFLALPYAATQLDLIYTRSAFGRNAWRMGDGPHNAPSSDVRVRRSMRYLRSRGLRRCYEAGVTSAAARA